MLRFWDVRGFSAGAWGSASWKLPLLLVGRRMRELEAPATMGGGSGELSGSWFRWLRRVDLKFEI